MYGLLNSNVKPNIDDMVTAQKFLKQNAKVVAFATQSDNFLIITLIQRCTLTDLCLYQLYELYTTKVSYANFKWTQHGFWPVSQHDMEHVIKHNIVTPPSYDHAIIRQLQKSHPMYDLFGCVMFSQISSVHVDLVKHLPSMIAPVIIFPVEYGYRLDDHYKFEENTRKYILNKASSNWILKLDGIALTLNLAHPIIVRLAMAMEVLNAKTGYIMVYNTRSLQFVEFPVLYDADRAKMIHIIIDSITEMYISLLVKHCKSIPTFCLDASDGDIDFPQKYSLLDTPHQLQANETIQQ